MQHFKIYSYKIILVILICFTGINFVLAQRPFITIWNSAEEGLGDSTQIVVPAQGDYTYSWNHVENGEINGTGNGSDTTTITFPEPGRYSLSITPDNTHQTPFHRIQFEADKQHPRYVSYPNGKLNEIVQWGDIPWSSFSHAFHGCDKLGQITADDVPDLSRVKNMSAIFASCRSLYICNQLNDWDMSNVEDISYMFCNITPFNEYIGDWDVSSVKNMEGLFNYALSFNQDIGNWDVGNVENMEATFAEAPVFNQDLSKWDVSNVKNMFGLFAGARFFRGDISTWDVSNVEDMRSMFSSCGFNSDISRWNVVNVKDMENIFWWAHNFDQDLGKWNLSSLQRDTRGRNDFSFLGSGMSCENYSKTLQGWAVNPDIAKSIRIYGKEYSPDIANYREFLINIKGWEFKYDSEGTCILSTAISKTLKSEVNVYPNPVANFLYIDSPENIKSLRLSDLYGKVSLNEENTIIENHIDLSNLSSGIYFLNLILSDGTITSHKIVKQ